MEITVKPKYIGGHSIEDVLQRSIKIKEDISAVCRRARKRC